MTQRPLFPPEPWEAAKARPAAPVAGPLFEATRPGPPCALCGTTDAPAFVRRADGSNLPLCTACYANPAASRGPRGDGDCPGCQGEGAKRNRDGLFEPEPCRDCQGTGSKGGPWRELPDCPCGGDGTHHCRLGSAVCHANPAR